MDADVSDAVSGENLEETILFAKNLSKQTGAIIAITGAIDIVADASVAYVIRNGHPIMSKITGTGCMLTSMIAAFVGANQENQTKATAAAISLMGLSGELAYERMMEQDAGTASFRMYLIDAVSKMDLDTLEGGVKIELR